MKKLEPAEWAWVGLLGYIFVVDTALGLASEKYMTDIIRESFKHPIKKWATIAAWGFTTKHLFFGNILPWLDPFSFIGLIVELVKKVCR
jgi:hypothetical protein